MSMHTVCMSACVSISKQLILMGWSQPCVKGGGGVSLTDATSIGVGGACTCTQGIVSTS